MSKDVEDIYILYTDLKMQVAKHLEDGERGAQLDQQGKGQYNISTCHRI